MNDLKSSHEVIKMLENEFTEMKVYKALTDLVLSMKSVKLGKYTINAIYNGTQEWNFIEEYTHDINDYLYSVTE